MVKLAKYYKVSIDGISTKVSSLAQAKKLVRKQEQWNIGKFEVKTGTCVGATDPKWIKNIKGEDGIYYKSTSCGKFTIAFIKSRIAK